MPSLATYIAFPGNARSAFEHYHEVLGGQLDLVTYGDMDLDLGFTPEPGAVANASLRLPYGEIAGGDAMDDGTDYNIGGSAYSLLLTLEDADEARRLINAFVDGGGEAAMPFELAPWGDFYGTVFDQFGVMWAFSVPARPAI